MTRPPPRSTLFPSAALFRSLEPQELRDRERRDGDAAAGTRPRVRAEAPDQFLGADAWARACGSIPAAADRKSTRLNSRHLVISYAGLCLKKTKTAHDALTSR